MMEEHKLKKRDWTETKANSSWQIFKFMAEFVQGFEMLAKIGPCISIFGSARTKPEEKYYEFLIVVIIISNKGIESLSQTQIFKPLYFKNQML